MQFHEAIARALVSHGITTIFGLIGDGNLFMMDSFQRHAGGRYISLSHEAAVVEAAIGYAHTSGDLGVASVTHGPALTNTVTPLVEAVRARLPLLLVAGDTAAADPENLQNIDQEAVVHSTGAGFQRVSTPESLYEDLATAIRRAHSERRPIVLNVPIEFQWLDVEYVDVVAVDGPDHELALDPAALDVAVGLIASARRPLVLVGRGAIDSVSRASILRFADRIGAPLSTTLKARDLFRGETYDIGILGTLSHEVGLGVIERSDCVIAFGASLNRFTTAEGSLAVGRKIVQIDTDPESFGRHVPVDAAVRGNAAAVAEAFIEWLDEAGVEASGFASDDLAARLSAVGYPDFKDRSTDATIDLRSALLRAEAAIPPDRNIVIDVGRYLFAACQILTVTHPRDFVHCFNFAAVGLGTGTAIGASIGAPGKPTVLVVGDGGFMLGGIAEFSTACRHGSDLIVLMMNDGAFGAEHIQFVNRGMDPSLSVFDWPDFGPVATALGGEGFTVRTHDELDAALAAIAGRTRPILIDIKIDPSAVPAPGH